MHIFSRQFVTMFALLLQLGLAAVSARGILCFSEGTCGTWSHNQAASQRAQAKSDCCGRCAEKAAEPETEPVSKQCPADCNCCFEVAMQHTHVRPVTMSLSASLELSLAASWAVAAMMQHTSIPAMTCTAPYGMPPPHAPLQPPAVGLSTVCLII